MNFGQALGYILALVPTIVRGIQVTVGDSQNGLTKAQMAQDALTVAVNGASSVLTGSNAVYASVAGEVAQVAIDQTVAIAKANGSYDAWTQISKAATQDLAIGTAVAGVVKAVQGSAAVQGQPAPTTSAVSADASSPTGQAKKIE